MKFEDIPIKHPKYDLQEDLTCFKCGEKLIPKWQPKIAYYAKGKPTYFVKLKCPRMTWWNRHEVGLYTSEGGWWHLLNPRSGY